MILQARRSLLPRSRAKRLSCICVCIILVVCCLPIFRWAADGPHASSRGPPTSPYRERTIDTWKDLRVAVVEFAPYHEEVWGAAVHAFGHLGANVTFFRPPYRFSFGDIFDGVDMSNVLDPLALPAHLEADNFDVVVILSGDKYWVDDKTRRALASAKNASVILLLHHIASLGVERYSLDTVAAEGRLSLLGLSGHTTDMIRSTIANWSMEDNQIGWDRTLVDTFVPVFPISTNTNEAGDRKSPAGKIVPPSRVAIQGRLEHKRRDYKRIFRELHQAISDDPALWGYETGVAGEPFYVHSATATGSLAPFSLHLIGEDVGEVTWPSELDNVVHVHSGLDYREYFDLLSSMHLVMPAFAGSEYMAERASSSMTAAIMAKVPLLVTPQHLRSYTFIGEPAVRLHPGGMGAVQAIGRLRANQDPWTSDLIPVNPRARTPSLAGGVSSSDTRHYHRDWEHYHEELYAENDGVWADILARHRWRIAEPYDIR